MASGLLYLSIDTQRIATLTQGEVKSLLWVIENHAHLDGSIRVVALEKFK